MKRFLRNELYQMVHYKHFQMANLRLVYLTFYTVRGFYTIFNRKNLPKIIPLDPLMSIGNILQFNDLFILTFTMITLFFALINYFYLFSKKTSLTWNIIYDLIVRMTDFYLNPSGPYINTNGRKIYLQNKVYQRSKFVLISERLFGAKRVFTDQLVWFAFAKSNKSRFFPEMDPVSKFLFMFLLNSIDCFHSFLQKFFGKL